MTSPYNPFSLVGKTILVTGATSGIGRATAIECSKMGATIILTGRNEIRLSETLNLLEGNNHIKISADLCDEEKRSKLVNMISKIDGLVHAAGKVKTLPFQFLNKVSITDTFEINFIAPTLLTQQLIKTKKINEGGSIVFISSINGPTIASVGHSAYAASKGAISAVVKNIAIEVASKHIRVNGILPGMTETPLIHRDAITDEQLEVDRKNYPLKRYGEPKEIAFAAIYLLSDASAWVTGTNLIIDGGFTLI